MNSIGKFLLLTMLGLSLALPDQKPPLRIIFPAEEPVGKNRPCPCGSGKKFKLCCLGKKEPK